MLIPRFEPAVWRVLCATTLSAIGTGLTLPYLLVYLHSVRGLEVATAGAVIASIGMVSMVGNPLGGWLTDRHGARSAMTLGLAVAGAGALGWAGATSPWQAFAAAALSGLGVSVSYPAQAALLAQLSTTGQRSASFAIDNASLNGGLAAGALLASLLVDTARPGTFSVLYLLDALSFVVAVGVVRSVPQPRRDAPATRSPDAIRDERPAGYRSLVRNRLLVRICLVSALLSAAGWAQFGTALPLIATGHAGLTPADLGLVYAANTTAVVLLQLAVLKVVTGRRRTRVAAVLGPLWGVCWALVLVATAVGDAALSRALFIAGVVVFALGETLMWPTLPAIVNDIAPPSLRGRYNGAFTVALTSGMVFGPLAAGFALGHGYAVPLLSVLVAVCALSGLLVLRLERSVPPEVNLPPGGGHATQALAPAPDTAPDPAPEPAAHRAPEPTPDAAGARA